MTERTAQLGARFTSGVTSPNPRLPTRLENPSRRALFFAFKRGLRLLGPRRPRKNLHVCVLNLAGSVSGHRVFTNPQVDGLQGFELLPPAELKRKHAAFLRAGKREGRRNPPSRARMPTPSAVLSSIRDFQPAACCACSPRPQCPGTFGFPTTVRQSPTVCHIPRLPAHVVSRAIACDASQFRTVSSPPRHGRPRFTECLAPRRLQLPRGAPRQRPLPFRRDPFEQPGAQEREGHEDERAASVSHNAHPQAAHHNATQCRAAADAEVEDA